MVIGCLGKGIALLLVLPKDVLCVLDSLRGQDIDPVGQRNRIMESKQRSLFGKKIRSLKKKKNKGHSDQRSAIQRPSMSDTQHASWFHN